MILVMVYKNLIGIAGCLVVLGIVMTATSPDNFSASLLGLVFLLLYVLTVFVMVLIFQVLNMLRFTAFSMPKIMKVSTAGSIVPVFMLILHSIGQLTFRDILLAITFFVLLYFYFSRMNSKAQV